MKITKLIELGLILAILLVLEKAFAMVWSQSSAPTNKVWNGIASSGNGMVILVMSSATSPLLSTDAGNTWATNTTSPTGYTCAATSANGTKMAASFFGAGGISIYTSADSGKTWAQTGAPKANWLSLASSADGVKLVAGISTGLIWLSTNSGSTWQVSTAPSKGWGSLASSADGTRLIGSGSGQIYISTNSGNNWTPTTIGGLSVATSADGRVLMTTGSGGTYVSTNFGGSWLTNAINGQSAGINDAITSSADGKRLAVAGNNTPIYTSADSGVTWETNTVPTGWNGIASSADGCRLAALRNGFNGIWIGQLASSPQLNLKATNAGLAFSWTMPSTNFVLQQNPDLRTISWTTLTNVPVLNLTNLQDEVEIPITNGNGFYRLLAQ